MDIKFKICTDMVTKCTGQDNHRYNFLLSNTLQYLVYWDMFDFSFKESIANQIFKKLDFDIDELYKNFNKDIIRMTNYIIKELISEDIDIYKEHIDYIKKMINVIYIKYINLKDDSQSVKYYDFRDFRLKNINRYYIGHLYDIVFQSFKYLKDNDIIFEDDVKIVEDILLNYELSTNELKEIYIKLIAKTFCWNISMGKYSKNLLLNDAEEEMMNKYIKTS